MPEAAVGDTSTILHLVEIDRPDLLCIFETITISQQVRAELRHHSVLEPVVIALSDRLQVHKVTQEKLTECAKMLAAFKLHQADISTAALADILRPDVVLTDDLALRKALEAQGWTVAGSVGVLVRAFKQGIIQEVEMFDCLDKLFNGSSLYTSKAFRARVRRMLGELDT